METNESITGENNLPDENSSVNRFLEFIVTAALVVVFCFFIIKFLFF